MNRRKLCTIFEKRDENVIIFFFKNSHSVDKRMSANILQILNEISVNNNDFVAICSINSKQNGFFLLFD